MKVRRNYALQRNHSFPLSTQTIISLVVHHGHFGFIQVEHLAKFFRDLKLVTPGLRREGLLVSKPDQFLRIGLNVRPSAMGRPSGAAPFLSAPPLSAGGEG